MSFWPSDLIHDLCKQLLATCLASPQKKFQSSQIVTNAALCLSGLIPDGTEHCKLCLMPELSWPGSDHFLMQLLVLSDAPHASPKHSVVVHLLSSGAQSTIHASCITHSLHPCTTVDTICNMYHQCTLYVAACISQCTPRLPLLTHMQVLSTQSTYRLLQFMADAQDKHKDDATMPVFALNDSLQFTPCS